ncbi:MAG TPA: dTDP-4-dehydrorhamnose reductase [Syntrophales bacterium]|nr:dTDP-4-dehydrorhamnose reductase [Syntrophales bacterium]
MKILILGHKGMLGADLRTRLSAGHEVVGKDIDEIDVTDAAACRETIGEVGPDIVINTAAFTDVDGCESSRDRCFAVNALAVEHIVSACRPRNIPIVHFSTDYVFDGSKGSPYVEEDVPGPLNVYGQSKLEGEKLLQSSSDNYLLIRSQWLYGAHGKNFVRTILEKGRSLDVVEVVDDQIGSPTYTADLAQAVQRLVETGQRGVFHVTNRGSCSWFEFTKKIFEFAGMSSVQVHPIKSSQLSRPARRPVYSVFSCRKFFAATGKTLRFWQVALSDYLSGTGY